LLGPLELSAGRRTVNLGGSRQRIVLAMLALNHGRVTSVGQLIDAVWDTGPPSTARGQIQFCISALRKQFTDAGEPGAVITYPAGYQLEIGPIELDSVEFAEQVAIARQQAANGQLAEAAETLRAGLALWRGMALAGVNSEMVRRGAAVLEDMRMAAVEERVRLDLALGRHEEIIGELSALVEEEPLRERRYGFLMLALYRAERQAEALELARRARTTLVEELGVEPGPELQGLELAILNRSPSLELSSDKRPMAAGFAAAPRPQVQERSVVPRQLPASIADFTGREEQLAEIRELLLGGDEDRDQPDTDSYAVRIVEISGKGGVGKSALAIRVARELLDEFPDGQLYGEFRYPGDDRTGKPLERFLRALGVSGWAIPDDVQEQAKLYRSMLADKRILVVLDDVTSEDDVRSLLPGSPTCAVVATSRIRMSGLSGVRRVDIDALDTDRSMELLAKIIGHRRVQAERDAAVKLVNFCGGLPLALRIAGARLAAKPHWRIAGLVHRLEDETSRLDEFNYRGFELRFNIGLSYEDLCDKAKRLFRLFALVRAPDFPMWTAAALLDIDLFDAEDVLESLIDARLLDIVEYPGQHVRYRFHNLIRVYALERLMATESRAERDAALARLLGAWLALAEQAHRREYGGDFTILHSDAARWQPPGAGARADLLAELDAPGDWWETERRGLVAAIRQAADAGFDDLCWDLALTAVTLFETKGYFDDWHETTRLGLELAERTGNRDGEAAMIYSFGTLHMFQKRLTEAQECFTSALTLFRATGNPHGCALVQRNAAIVDGMVGNVAAMLDKYDEALELMRAVGDRMGEAQILRSLARFRIDEGELETGHGMLEMALAICRDVRCVRGEAQVLHQFAYLHLSTEEYELAGQEFSRVLTIVRKIGDRVGETYALHGLGIVRYRQGTLDQAHSTMGEALALARQIGERLVVGQSLFWIGQIRLGHDDQRGGATHFAEAAALFDELGSTLWHAKALVLLVEARVADGEPTVVDCAVSRARELLSGVGSKEAARWLAQLDTLESTLLTGGHA
jgi:DNA-binding SARP family transcriptional activator